MSEPQTMKIYKCNIGFINTYSYIKVILISPNKMEAKRKFIKRCLEEYDKVIKHINFNELSEPYDSPLSFDNAEAFETWLDCNIDDDENNPDTPCIECLNDCSFELCRQFED